MADSVRDERPPFIRIDKAVWSIVTEIGAVAFLVYAALAERASNGDGRSWPSRAKIAADTGLSVRTVGTALAKLASAGLITIEHRSRADGGQTSSLYTLLSLAYPQGNPYLPPGQDMPTELETLNKNHDNEGRQGQSQNPFPSPAPTEPAPSNRPEKSGSQSGRYPERASEDDPWLSLKRSALADFGQDGNTRANQRVCREIAGAADANEVPLGFAIPLWREWFASIQGDQRKYYKWVNAGRDWGEWLSIRRHGQRSNKSGRIQLAEVYL